MIRNLHKNKWNYICLLTGLLTMMLSGCVNYAEESSETNVTISFSSEAVTRASGIISDINVRGAKFGIFAKKANPFNNAQTWVFENVPQEVEYDGNNWIYDPVQKWYKYYYYYFRAYYPLLAPNQVSMDFSDHAIVINDFDTSVQTDLLLSEPYVNTNGTPELIDLNFKHILTNVSIRIKKKDWEEAVTLNSFRFTGMKMAGTFRDNRTPEWEPAGNAYTGNLFELPKAIELTDENAFTALFADKLMIPQPIGWDMLFTFTYTYDAILYTKEIRLLSKGLTDAWQTGKKITYSLTITPENILFEPIEVTPWGEGEGENIVVNPQ